MHRHIAEAMRAAIPEQDHEDLGPRAGDLGLRSKLLLGHPRLELTSRYGSHRIFIILHRIYAFLSRSLSYTLSPEDGPAPQL